MLSFSEKFFRWALERPHRCNGHTLYDAESGWFTGIAGILVSGQHSDSSMTVQAIRRSSTLSVYRQCRSDAASQSALKSEVCKLWKSEFPNRRTIMHPSICWWSQTKTLQNLISASKDKHQKHMKALWKHHTINARIMWKQPTKSTYESNTCHLQNWRPNCWFSTHFVCYRNAL